MVIRFPEKELTRQGIVVVPDDPRAPNTYYGKRAEEILASCKDGRFLDYSDLSEGVISQVIFSSVNGGPEIYIPFAQYMSNLRGQATIYEEELFRTKFVPEDYSI